MKTNFLLFIFAADHIGKVDKHSLSQETLMELLTGGILNKSQITRSTETPQVISDWRALHLNDAHEIAKVHWGFHALEGSIELQWLPLTVRECLFCFNQLSGTVDLSFLPDCLDYMNLANNRFEGTIDLRHLPSRMEQLFLYKNNFRGVTDFSCLPQSLNALDIRDTLLEGEVHFFKGKLAVTNSNVKDVRNL